MEIEEAKRRARAGQAILLGRRVAAILITLASTMIIARMVDARAYGLANMAIVLLSFGQVFRDFGMTNAVLRKGVISQEEMSFIFWFNCGMTAILTIIIAIISPLVANFYSEPVVIPVIIVSLIGFLFGGISLQHKTLLDRELRFGAVAVIDISSLFINFLVSFSLALIFHNVWAIVWGIVAQNLMTAISVVAVSKWRPDRPRRPADLTDLLKFGANTSLFSISTFLSNNTAPILIGHFLGTAALGQFNRAQALFQMPSSNLIQPITQATLPLLTRLRQDPVEYRLAYLTMIRKLCALVIPLSITLTFAAIPLVEALLGSKWHQAGVVFAGLAPALAAFGVAYSISDLFITQDRSAELRQIGLWEMGLRIGVISASVPFGLLPAAIAFSISTLIAAVIRLYVSGRSGPVTRGDQLQAVIPSIPMGFAAFLVCSVIDFYWPTYFNSPLLQAVLLILGGAAAAISLGAVMPSSRSTIIELLVAFGMGPIVQIFLKAKSSN